MSWEDWIVRQASDENKMSSYDFLCELCVSSYNLDKKSRKADLKDKLHFFIFWWNNNKSKMIKYNTLQKIGKLLDVDHTTVIHHLKRRKPTILFDDNVKCISDFLNS